MQEEIENRTVNLAISTTKLTARGIIRLAAKGLAYIKRKSREAALKNEKPDGRQTIQQLIGQNQGVTNIDISQPISRDSRNTPANTVLITPSQRINPCFRRSIWCSSRRATQMP